MRVRRFNRGLIAGLAVAVSGLGVLLLPASPASAVTFSNACTNSVTANATQLDVDLTASAPATVEPGATFQLTNIQQTLALPGTIFVAGYNLGLLQVGLNTIPGNVRTTIEGTNTVEGTQNTPVTVVSVQTTITDPDGVRGSGDELATPASVTVSYPDQTWTAGPAGAIEFREDTVPLAVNAGGILINATIGGFLQVQFRCSPGTVTPPDPGIITLTDPAVSFASTVSEPTTTTTTVAETTTTTVAETTTTTEPPTTTTTEPPTTTTTEPPTTTTTEPPTTTTTAPPTTTTTTPPLVDGALNVIVSGPTRSAAGDKSVVAKVTNLGTGSLTVCNTDIAWDIEVNGVNTTGSVSQPAGCKVLGPGSSTRFKAKWTFGAGEVTAGAVVDYSATLTVTGDFNTANNTDTETRTAK